MYTYIHRIEYKLKILVVATPSFTCLCDHHDIIFHTRSTVYVIEDSYSLPNISCRDIPPYTNIHIHIRYMYQYTYIPIYLQDLLGNVEIGRP